MPLPLLQQYWQSLTPAQKVEHQYRWSFWARDDQLAPVGDWFIWLILAGRGWGKTRTGAEWMQAEAQSARRRRMALIGPSAADIRDTMIEGESGLLGIAPPWFRPVYHPSLRKVEWPNGVEAITYSAEDPDQLRGPNIYGAWCDELAAWKYAQEAWDMLMFTLRAGNDPRAVVTTTPRPTPIVKGLVASPTTHLTRGSTYDNQANLAATFFTHVVKKYEGTRLGRQELNAEILDDTPGALWQRAQLDALRVSAIPDLYRIVVAIDPAISADEGSDETGIVAAGVGSSPDGDGAQHGYAHGYVLDDVSLRASPHGWASEAIALYHKLHADRIVAEANQGGDMVASTLHTVDASVPVTLVHAHRGKYTRAEPVAALYEQGRVHHVGMFAALEDQQCTWVQGDKSPDRLDALVWALTDLLLPDGDDDVPAAGAPFIGGMTRKTR